MTTAVSDVYDAIVSLIEANLSDYAKLPNPYQNDFNNELFLTKGYGVAFGPAQNSNRFVSCKLSVNRSFAVFLTHLIDVTDHDITGHALLEKNLLEDQFKLIKALENDPSLGGKAANARYQSDGGIEILEGDRTKFLFIETDVAVEYIENL